MRTEGGWAHNAASCCVDSCARRGAGCPTTPPAMLLEAPADGAEAMLGRQLPDTARQVEGGHTSSQSIQAPGMGSDFPPNVEDVGLGQRETGVH